MTDHRLLSSIASDRSLKRLFHSLNFDQRRKVLELADGNDNAAELRKIIRRVKRKGN